MIIFIKGKKKKEGTALKKESREKKQFI